MIVTGGSSDQSTPAAHPVSGPSTESPTSPSTDTPLPSVTEQHPAAPTTDDIASVLDESFRRRFGDPSGETPPEQPEPAAEPAPEPTPDPAGQAPPVEQRVIVPLGDGQQAELSIDEVRQLIHFGAWGTSLTDQQREAMGAVESGVAVAVPRDEFTQFEAWRQSRPDQAETLSAEDLEQIDPVAAAEIRRLRTTTEQQQAQLAAHAQQPQIDETQRRIQQADEAFEQAAGQYMADYGLTQEEMRELFDSTLQANVIGPIAQQHRQYNPATNALLADADYGQVAVEAFDFVAFRQFPQIAQRVQAARAAQPQPQPQSPAPAQQLRDADGNAVSLPYQDPTTPAAADPIPGLPPTETPVSSVDQLRGAMPPQPQQPQPHPQQQAPVSQDLGVPQPFPVADQSAVQQAAVDAKRARAGSLASAPSATTTTPPPDLAKMSFPDIAAQIAAEIRTGPPQ